MSLFADPAEIETLFTRQDGSYAFARWGRPIAPIVFGVDDATLQTVKGAVEAGKAGALHGLAHITGGGLTENLPRAIPPGLGVKVNLDSWTLPPVFRWLAETGGVTEVELLKTFNAGIGMVAIVPEAAVAAATACFQGDGHDVQVIGHVVPGEGVAYEGRLL